MELWNLIRCEFIKNFSWKKNIIVVLILLICGISLIKVQDFFKVAYCYSDRISISGFDSGYEQAKTNYKINPSLINEGILDVFDKIEKHYKKVYELVGNSDKNSWQRDALNNLILGIPQEVALNQLINNYQSEEIKNFLDNYEENVIATDNIYTNIKDNYINILKVYYDKPMDEINKKLDYISEKNKLVIKAIEEDAYYLAVRVECLNDEYWDNVKQVDKKIYDEHIKYCDYFNTHEIKSDKDYRSINAYQQQQLSNSLDYYIFPTDDISNALTRYDLENYSEAERFYHRMYKYVSEEKTIVDYAFSNDLKHDAILIDVNDNIEHTYHSSKSYMNLGLHFGTIILIVVTITNAGIVSKEHDKGTIKLLLTKPVNRSKVLLSKYLYLILDTYIWWIIASIIMLFLAGYKCGFTDLFTSKIIELNGVAKEVNYLLWYFKELIICSIPICFFLCVLFSLSTITLSTALTASITSIISILSVAIWSMISNFKLTFLQFLVYTPIPYIDYWFVRYHNLYYIKTIVKTPLNDSYGIIISIILSVLLFILTSLIYNKRDIKN